MTQHGHITQPSVLSPLLAGMFGFDKRPYFESEEGADKAPKVEF